MSPTPSAPPAAARAELLAQIERLVRDYYAAPAAEPAGPRRIGVSSAILGPEEALAALRTVLSGWITQGQVTAAFEANFAAYVGVQHAVAVNSGSSANLLALAALVELGRLRRGDEVIVPATTFATVAAPLLQLGLVPVYADVCADTYNLDPAAAAAACSPRTRAIMAVHTVGHPADVDALAALAQQHGLLLFEDCCEAHGAMWNGRTVGSVGLVGTFSFFVAHNMTTGEGGMIVTNDAELAAVCRSLREFGRIDQRNVQQDRFYSDAVLKEYDRRYVFERAGYNMRMTDVTAALGVEQLKKLDGFNARRREHAASYRRQLAPYADWLEPATERPGAFHTYYTFAMTIRDAAPFARREFVGALEAAGIETRPIFAGCLPDQPAFRQAPQRVAGELPAARRIRDRALFIGVHPGLSEDDVRYVTETIQRFCEAARR